MSAELVLNDVFAGYGNVSILQGVNLEVAEGETLAILGPNGSGKSTMAKTLLNLTTQHSGSISWRGQDVTRLASWRRVRAGMGYLPQGVNVFASLTVAENLSIALARTSRSTRRAALADVIDQFPEFSRLAKSLAGNLSGGERRVLALAVTLLAGPKILVLDEPTSDLAPVLIDRIIDMISEVRSKSGLAIVMVEQNVERALAFADRVCVLRRGSIVLDGAVRDVAMDQIINAFMETSQRGTGSTNLSVGG